MMLHNINLEVYVKITWSKLDAELALALSLQFEVGEAN